MIDVDDLKRFRRELNAMLVRAGSDDPEAFAQVVQLLDQARDGLAVSAAMLREPHGDVPGYSWADLAAPLGIRRQTAAVRFSRPAEHTDCAHCGDRIVPLIDCPTAGIGRPDGE